MDIQHLFPLFSPSTGLLVLFVYASIVWALTTVYTRNYNKTKNGFLVANRQLGYLQGSMSVAAAWVWAPAMFISCLQGYTNGLAGVVPMVIGNFFAVVMFGAFSKKIKEQQPEGFTVSGFLREKFGPRVQTLIGIEMCMLAIAAFSVNLMAGSQALSVITGMDYSLITVLVPSIALSYALRGGLKASVVTEIIKILVFITMWITIAFWAIDVNGGWSVVLSGIGGKTGNGAVLWGNDFANNVLMGFGIPTVLGLLSGTWADNTFYQRAQAIRKEIVVPAFMTAAFLAISITIIGGCMGFLAAGMHIEVPKNLMTYTNLVIIGTSLPIWVSLFVMFVMFAGLISVLDSQLGTGSSMLGNDLCNRFSKDPEANSVWWSRVGMIILAAMAIGVVNIPGMTLLTLFLIYGVGRACVWLPIMISLIKDNFLTERGMFWGILICYLTGFPLYLYGVSFGGGNTMVVAGTLVAVVGSGVMSVLISQVDKRIAA